MRFKKLDLLAPFTNYEGHVHHRVRQELHVVVFPFKRIPLLQYSVLDRHVKILFNYDLCIIRCRYRIFCKALHDCYIVQHKIQLNSTFSVHDMRIKIKRQNCFNFTLPSPGISSKSCKILNNQISQCKIFHVNEPDVIK